MLGEKNDGPTVLGAFVGSARSNLERSRHAKSASSDIKGPGSQARGIFFPAYRGNNGAGEERGGTPDRPGFASPRGCSSLNRRAGRSSPRAARRARASVPVDPGSSDNDRHLFAIGREAIATGKKCGIDQAPADPVLMDRAIELSGALYPPLRRAGARLLMSSSLTGLALEWRRASSGDTRSLLSPPV